MNVLFLDPVGTLGGGERSLLDLVASLRACEPSLRMSLVAGADGPLVGEAQRLGMEVRVVPLPERLSRTGDSGIQGALGLVRRAPALAVAGAEMAGYAFALRRAVRELAPAVVHSNGMKMHVLSALLPVPRVPVVWHLRDYVGPRPVMAHALRGLVSRAHGLLAISRSIAEDAARALGRDDVAVVYNAIDTARFAPDAGPAGALDLDALAGLGPAETGTVRVGLVATYARWKGQELFLDAAALLARQARAAGAPPVRFYVIGGQAYATESSQFGEAELRAAIASRGLDGVAGLVPFQAAPERAYRALDVVVHASTRPEPFGRTIAEAMACARAVVVAREGGAAELITDDVDAVGVPPRDAAALSHAIGLLAADPARRARLGDAGRATALRRFSRARLGPEVLAAYERARARARAADES